MAPSGKALHRRISLAALCALQVIGLAGTACIPASLQRGQVAGALSGAVGGTLDFGRSAYQTQVTVGEVAIAATVSLIDTQSNKTIATALTDSSGNFVIDMGRFTPVPGKVYILEAIKGLSANRAGADAVRLRTFIRHDGSDWSTITGGNVSISPKTTALCIIASFRGLPPAGFIGKLTSGTFDPSGTGTTQEELDAVEVLVRQALDGNLDPLFVVRWDGTKWELKETASSEPPPPVESIRIIQVSPNPSATGQVMTIVGLGVGADGLGAQVRFGDVAAQVVNFSAETLTVIVPTGARSGLLSVSNSLGTATMEVTVVGEVLGGIDPEYEATPVPTPTPEPTFQPGSINGGLDGEYLFEPTPEPTVNPGGIGGGLDGEYEFVATPEPTWNPGGVGGGIDSYDPISTGSIGGGIE